VSSLSLSQVIKKMKCPFFPRSRSTTQHRASDREAVVHAAAAAAAAAANNAAAGGSGNASSSAISAAAAVAASSAAVNPASSSSTAASSSSGDRERDNIFRWRDRQYFGPKRWLESALRDSGAWSADGPPQSGSGQRSDEDMKKRGGDQQAGGSAGHQSPLWLGDELEMWPEKGGVRFSRIAALNGELVAVSDKGHLYQWRWCDLTPFRGDNPSGNHPRAAGLALTSEKVVMISASNIRCSVVTESGKVATWMDESVAHVCGKLEQPATPFPAECQSDKILSLHTCVLYSAVRMESGCLYWWGILPFAQRKKLLERHTNKKKMIANEAAGRSATAARKGSRTAPSGTSTAAGSSASSDIANGSVVCMRNVPVFQAGSIGFTVAGGVPKVGQLLNSAWNVTDTCRFKIVQPPKRPKLPELPREKDKAKEEYDSASMPPPPSPASSTCSDGSISSPAAAGPGRRQKRSAPKEEGPDEKVDEEEWSLKDVIFVEEHRVVPCGKVVKVDGPYVAVRFNVNNKDQKEAKDDDVVYNDNIRLLRKDELQVLKSGLLPKLPECFQRVPKKVCLQSEPGHAVMALTVDVRGVQAVMRGPDPAGRMALRIFNLNSGKIESESRFPTVTKAFVGGNGNGCNNVRFRSTGENETVSMLVDGNSTVYPVVRDSTPSGETIKNPHWLDLTPIEALGLGTHALPHVGSGKKNEVAVIVMSLTPQLLMPKILKCDIHAVRKVLDALEGDPASDATIETVQKILDERCDGGRNVLHAAVTMCQPTSNKDPDSDAPLPGQSEHISSNMSSRALNLRDMMRRAAAASRMDMPSQVASVGVAAAAAMAHHSGPGSSPGQHQVGQDLDDPGLMHWQHHDTGAEGGASGEDDALLGLVGASKR